MRIETVGPTTFHVYDGAANALDPYGRRLLPIATFEKLYDAECFCSWVARRDNPPTLGTGGPAFPVIVPDQISAPVESGLTMRDWFGGQALLGIIGRSRLKGDGALDAEVTAGMCYTIADAMLIERAK